MLLYALWLPHVSVGVSNYKLYHIIDQSTAKLKQILFVSRDL
jgi:hypothetical protein